MLKSLNLKTNEKNTRTHHSSYLPCDFDLRFNIWETMSATPKRPESKKETLQEFEYRLKCEAKALSLAFKGKKVTKYLLK